MEIIVVLGEFLAIPNEAIIEREGSQVVFRQRDPGHYEPIEIHTGRRGELYTEVLHGLAEGDQVVTIGGRDAERHRPDLLIINQMRERGVTVGDAVRLSAELRLRPVLMTASLSSG